MRRTTRPAPGRLARPNADQFLATWATGRHGAPTSEFRVDGSLEYEVFGKKLDGGGNPLEDDTQISNHRPDDGRQFDGDLPAVTYDRATCDYVVGWTGENAGEFANEKKEIWGRAYDAPSCPGEAEARTRTGAANVPACSARARGTSRSASSVAEAGCTTTVLIKVNGQPVKVSTAPRPRQVNLTGLPPGRFSVEIEATLKSGRKLKGARRYLTCSPRQPPSNGLEREDAL